jgi:dolichyl-phosphate beta-glucosyltransferase
MSSFAIIVPCYNEASRIKASEFIDCANRHPDVAFYFVNDGSTDDTDEKLLHIQQTCKHVKIITLKKNYGKGEAVRQGLIAASNDKHGIVGYLDADLSTDIEEFIHLKTILVQENLDMVLGSRIQKIDTQIERSFFRHIIGRTIATIIDQKFKLGVYDTQCGAKIFRYPVIGNSIQECFYTRWFFDVELLLRIKKTHHPIAAEIPLSKWQNVRNSKLSMLSFPAVVKDVWVLLNKY